jgi:8-oxo-dGTP pyrophosphatase MutT (NUDIX family)
VTPLPADARIDAATGCPLVPITAVEAKLAPFDWPWARANADRIAAHWEARRAAVPALFNGPVLLSSRQAVAQGVLRADYFRTEYRTFLAFKEFGFPDPAVRNGFAMAALRGADGAFVLGVMGGQTANAGRVYFPAGTPDPEDLRPDGTVDLAGSVLRELDEETGLSAADYAVEPGFTLVLQPGMTALMRPVRLHEAAEAAAARIRATLATQAEPELADVRVVRDPRDLDPDRMAPFVRAYLADAFATPG